MRIDISFSDDYGAIFEVDGEMVGTLSHNPIGYTVWVPNMAMVASTPLGAIAKLFPGTPEADLARIYDKWSLDGDDPRHCWVGSVLEVA